MNKDELLNIKSQLQKVCDSRRGCFNCKLYWRAKNEAIESERTPNTLPLVCALEKVQKYLGELAEKVKEV